MDLTASEHYRKPAEGAMTTEERGIVSSAEILILPARSLSATLGIVGGLVFRKDAAGATISFGQGNDEMNTIHSFIHPSPWTCGSWKSKGTLELDPLGLVLAARYIWYVVCIVKVGD